MSNSGSQTDENSDVAPGGRKGNQNHQEITDNLEMTGEPSHAQLRSGQPLVHSQEQENSIAENNSGHGPAQVHSENGNLLVES